MPGCRSRLGGVRPVLKTRYATHSPTAARMGFPFPVNEIDIIEFFPYSGKGAPQRPARPLRTIGGAPPAGPLGTVKQYRFKGKP
jgi:hypothetical protein